jgi:hypothetical protein
VFVILYTGVYLKNDPVPVAAHGLPAPEQLPPTSQAAPESTAAHPLTSHTRTPAQTAAGTVEFDPELGVPVILYTGVYLKTNADSVAGYGLPAPEHDPGTRFVEKQLAAVPADPSKLQSVRGGGVAGYGF